MQIASIMVLVYFVAIIYLRLGVLEAIEMYCSDIGRPKAARSGS